MDEKIIPSTCVVKALLAAERGRYTRLVLELQHSLQLNDRAMADVNSRLASDLSSYKTGDEQTETVIKGITMTKENLKVEREKLSESLTHNSQVLAEIEDYMIKQGILAKTDAVHRAMHSTRPTSADDARILNTMINNDGNEKGMDEIFNDLANNPDI